jgi:hypothetical protein
VAITPNIPTLYPARLEAFTLAPSGTVTFTVPSYSSLLITKLQGTITGPANDGIYIAINGTQIDVITSSGPPIGVDHFLRDYFFTLLSSDTIGLTVLAGPAVSASGVFGGYYFAPSS